MYDTKVYKIRFKSDGMFFTPRKIYHTSYKCIDDYKSKTGKVYTDTSKLKVALRILDNKIYDPEKQDLCSLDDIEIIEYYLVHNKIIEGV